MTEQELLRIALGPNADDGRRWAYLNRFDGDVARKVATLRRRQCSTLRFLPFETSQALCDEAFSDPAATLPAGHPAETQTKTDAALEQFRARGKTYSKIRRTHLMRRFTRLDDFCRAVSDALRGRAFLSTPHGNRLLEISAHPDVSVSILLSQPLQYDCSELKTVVKSLHARDCRHKRLLPQKQIYKLAKLISPGIDPSLHRELIVLSLQACRCRRPGRAIGFAGRLKALSDSLDPAATTMRSVIQGVLSAVDLK